MKYRADIVSKHLDVVTESEEEYYCRCPFHSDNNPSFAVNKENWAMDLSWLSMKKVIGIIY